MATKIYQVDLSKGYAHGGRDSGRIPPGFVTLNNMTLHPDGTWQPRTTFVKNHSIPLPSSSKCPIDGYGENLDDIYVIHNYKIYKKNITDSSWTEVEWDGEGERPDIKKPVDWVNLGSYVVIGNDDLPPVKIYGSKYNYCTGTALTYKGPICEHQNRICVGNGDQIRYSDAGDPDAGYADNYVDIANGYDYIQGLFNVGGNLIVLKNRWVSRPVPVRFLPSAFESLVNSKLSRGFVLL